MPVHASPMYDTTQMAYSLSPYQFAYYSKNAWAASPAQMLGPLIVQALQNTHSFVVIDSSAFPGHYQYVLSTELMKLQQNFSGGYNRVELVARVELTNSLTKHVIATKQFSVTEPVYGNTPASVWRQQIMQRRFY